MILEHESEGVGTTTNTQEQTLETELALERKTINYCIFLAFVEYLGYVSPYLDWVLEICNGKDIQGFKKNILKIEASNIFKLVENEYSNEQLNDLYNTYHDVILKDYEQNIHNVLGEDYPF